MYRRQLAHLVVAVTMAPRFARADTPAAVCGVIDARVGSNHGHVLVVSPDDIAAGVDKTYEVKGSAGHNHRVTVTAADFRAIAAGQPFRARTTAEGGHRHNVLVRCGAPEPSAVTITIGGKDDHELIIPARDVTAGTEHVYDIQGAAPHSHSLTLEASHFERLRKGEKLTLSSTPGDAHTHLVYLQLARS